MIITIDGPTASGKSTIARLLANKLGIYYLSSGALFRGLAYALTSLCQYDATMIEHPISADVDRCLNPDMFVYTYNVTAGARVFLQGIDITEQLKTPMIDQYASIIGKDAYVREALANMQRAIGKKHDLVLEGRDSGSVIFPRADVKFFLTASVAVRADRWVEDQRRKGSLYTHDQAIAEITMRDKRDATRTLAPLVIPQDAIVIDNSDLSIEQTVSMCGNRIQALI